MKNVAKIHQSVCPPSTYLQSNFVCYVVQVLERCLPEMNQALYRKVLSRDGVPDRNSPYVVDFGLKERGTITNENKQL